MLYVLYGLCMYKYIFKPFTDNNIILGCIDLFLKECNNFSM